MRTADRVTSLPGVSLGPARVTEHGARVWWWLLDAVILALSLIPAQPRP